MDNGLSARYLLTEWMDFDQIVETETRTDQIFVTLIPFQGYTRAMILENGFSAPYLIEEWMNSDQTYI